MPKEALPMEQYAAHVVAVARIAACQGGGTPPEDTGVPVPTPVDAGSPATPPLAANAKGFK
jgi:hypothetical protein